MSKRVSVINFKGGVGKTTLAFHLGTGLARFHDARVLLIDMDHQSSLSIICLGTRAWEAVADSGETANKIFSNFNTGDIPGSEIIHRPQLRPNYSGVSIVPASLDLDDTEIELTASHQGNAIQSEWNKRTLMCRWIEETGVNNEYDYILFDCAPATKIVSQNAIAASHGYFIPVVPEAVMERGAPHLHNMIQSGIDDKLRALAALGRPRSMHVEKTHLVGLVVTRIQVAGRASSGYTNDHTQHLRSLQRQWEEDLLTPYISLGTGVSSALTDRTPVYDLYSTQNIGDRGIHRQYEELTDNLKSRMDDL